ncbi:hypothetical protein PHYC_01109 [Phycisphaerales bacterium]|nr:hypothetical protein PHYC_01109 [Phycisphaerales bacterium]
MKSTFAAASILALASSTHAAITGTAGMVTFGAPPPIANFPPLIGPTAQAWDEQQNIVVPPLMCEMTVNPSNSTTLTPGPVAGLVNSHFIHFTHFPAISATGDVFFSEPIVGVIFRDLSLDMSDGPAGALGTIYPTGQMFRGLNAGTIFISGNTLHFDFINPVPGIQEITQVRVLTRPVPAPGAAALAGIGGLLALRRRRA